MSMVSLWSIKAILRSPHILIRRLFTSCALLFRLSFRGTISDIVTAFNFVIFVLKETPHWRKIHINENLVQLFRKIRKIVNCLTMVIKISNTVVSLTPVVKAFVFWTKGYSIYDRAPKATASLLFDRFLKKA